jgi:hypothetical protein
METRARERRAKRPMVKMTSLQETFAMQQNPKNKGRMRKKSPGSETKKRKKAGQSNTRQLNKTGREGGRVVEINDGLPFSPRMPL